MKQTVRTITVVTLFALGLAVPSSAEQVGLIPIPVLENVKVEAGVSFDSTTGLYNYSYTIFNPSGNTGEIGNIMVDVSQPSKRLRLSSEGLTIPMGRTAKTFDESLQFLSGLNYQQMVPFGQKVPSGWVGAATASGFAAFGGLSKDVLIQPGVTADGFEIISRGLPAIRDVTIDPDWVHMVDNLEAMTPEEEKRGNEVPEEIRYHTKTVGPTAPPINVHGNFLPKALLMNIGSYVYEARDLGWITDAVFFDKLAAKHLEAKEAMHDGDLGQVVAVMDEFISLLNSSTGAQRTSDAYGLLYYNAEYLRSNMPTEETHSFNIELSPLQVTTVPLGSGIQFKARFTMDGVPKPDGTIWLYFWDQALGDWLDVDAEVAPADGNFGEWGSRYTDGSGEVIITLDFDEVPLERVSVGFRSHQIKEGTLKFTARMAGYRDWTDSPDYPTYAWWQVGMLGSNPVEIEWRGGPDLVMDYFIPPVIKVGEPPETVSDASPPLILEAMYASVFTTGGGQEITITEQVSNKGDQPAGPFVIRYYLSDDEVIAPPDQSLPTDGGPAPPPPPGGGGSADIFIGERYVLGLAPGESSSNGGVKYSLPPDHPAGTYYMGAIVDADSVIVETDKANNNLLAGEGALYAAIEEPTNQPPVCDQAFPGIATLWPPNHKTVKTGIVGVTDPDGDDIALKITGITQDEPVNGLGDGDTAPDGFGVGSSKAELRAERSGTGNGRVYAIHFAADDGNGGQCNGSVNVVVPHDKRKGSAAIDDGQAYNSTRP